jgi:hypothetical protein
MVVWWRCFTEAVYEHGNVGQLQKNGPRGHALEDMRVETGLLARPRPGGHEVRVGDGDDRLGPQGWCGDYGRSLWSMPSINAYRLISSR